jgi:hypothetical protein
MKLQSVGLCRVYGFPPRGRGYGGDTRNPAQPYIFAGQRHFHRPQIQPSPPTNPATTRRRNRTRTAP